MFIVALAIRVAYNAVMLQKLTRSSSFAMLLIYAVTLGGIAGLLTGGFVYVLEFVQGLIWNDLPTALGLTNIYGWYVVAACTLGGLLVGIGIHLLGNYPTTLEASLEHFKKTKAFDYKHLWQAAIISVISLGFGASLGPEAALTALIGGLATLIGVKLKSASFVSNSATVTARLPKAKRSLLALAAAVSGLLIFRLIDGKDGYFSVINQTYSFQASDLAWMLVVIAAGVIAGGLYLKAENVFESLFAQSRKLNIILTTTAGGLMLGMLAYIHPDVLFSGHENLDYLLGSIVVNGTWFFVSLALVKIAATTICLATGWKGGRFLPVLLIGAAAGLSLATFVGGLTPIFAMAIGMSAALSFVLKKPLIAGLLVACFFPLSLAIQIVLTAFIVSVLAKRMPRYQPRKTEV